MLQLLFVVALIGLPLGLFAAVVGVALRFASTDLVQLVCIVAAMSPMLCTDYGDVSGLLWVIAGSLVMLWLLTPGTWASRWRPSIQSLSAATFLAAVAAWIIRRGGVDVSAVVIDILLVAAGISVWSHVGIVIVSPTRDRYGSAPRQWLLRLGATAVMIAVTVVVISQDRLMSNLLWHYGTWPPMEDGSFSWLGDQMDTSLSWVWVPVLFVTGAVASGVHVLALWATRPTTGRSRFGLGCAVALIGVAVFASVDAFWILCRPSGLTRAPAASTTRWAELNRLLETIETEVDPNLISRSSGKARSQATIDRFLPMRQELIRILADGSISVRVEGQETDLDTLPAGAARRCQSALCELATRDLAVGNDERATESFQAAIQLAFAIRRDGLLIHALIGNAVSSQAIAGLWRERERLERASAFRLIRLLNQQLEDREPISVTEHRDQAWVRSAYGWFGRLQQVIHDSTVEQAAHRRSIVQAQTMETTRIRLLMLDFMIQQHFASSGEYPATLNELHWPDDLEHIAHDVQTDPMTGTSFRYILEGGRRRLYSVGWNRVDEGGESDPMGSVEGRYPDDIELAKFLSAR
ncbi:MAG: hypothetical protein AAF670_15165 [Planctomycetota bacterium]